MTDNINIKLIIIHVAVCKMPLIWTYSFHLSINLPQAVFQGLPERKRPIHALIIFPDG